MDPEVIVFIHLWDVSMQPFYKTVLLLEPKYVFMIQLLLCNTRLSSIVCFCFPIFNILVLFLLFKYIFITIIRGIAPSNGTMMEGHHYDR